VHLLKKLAFKMLGEHLAVERY